MNDGNTPDSDERTEQLACELRERVRDLNYATFGPPGLTAPQTIYAILGNLSEASYGLDQVLTQMGEFLEEELESEHLASTDEDGPELAVSQAWDELTEAIEHTQELSNALERAQRQIGLLFIPEPESPASTTTARHEQQVDDRSASALLAQADVPVSIGELLPQTGPRPNPPAASRAPTQPRRPSPAL